MSNFTFFHNVFHAICILKSFNSHISVVVFSFFEFGTVSKWCIEEWVKSICRRQFKIELMKSVFDREENITGIGENARYQHFSFSNIVFKTVFPSVTSSFSSCHIVFKTVFPSVTSSFSSCHIVFKSFFQGHYFVQYSFDIHCT